MFEANLAQRQCCHLLADLVTNVVSDIDEVPKNEFWDRLFNLFALGVHKWPNNLKQKYS